MNSVKHSEVSKWIDRHWVIISPALIAAPLVILAVLNLPVTGA